MTEFMHECAYAVGTRVLVVDFVGTRITIEQFAVEEVVGAQLIVEYVGRMRPYRIRHAGISFAISGVDYEYIVYLSVIIDVVD